MLIKNLRIIITGGSGFIGNALVEYLKNYYEIIVIDRNLGGVKGVKYIQKKFSEINSKELEGIDVVMHLAWSSAPATRLTYEQEIVENVKPSHRLFDLAIKSKVKKIIFFSSAGAVYGNAIIPFVETGPTNPKSTHGRAKLEVEKFLVNNKSFTNWVIIRPTNVIGLGQKAKRGHGLIPTILKSVRTNQELVIAGNAKKDYLAIDDLVKAVSLIILNPNLKGRFNIGSGQILSTLEIVELAQKALSIKVNYCLKPIRQNDVELVEVDTFKIFNMTNWQPKINIKKLIHEIINE